MTETEGNWGSVPKTPVSWSRELVLLPIRESAADHLDQANLPDLTAEFLAGLKPRRLDEVQRNPAVRKAINQSLNYNRFGQHRVRTVAAVRFCPVPEVFRREQPIFHRRGEYVSYEELRARAADNFPASRGYSAESASAILGLTVEAVLETEVAFLERYGASYPALKDLGKIVTAQLAKLKDS